MEKDHAFICVECLRREGEILTLMHLCWNCSRRMPCIVANKKNVGVNENSNPGKTNTESQS